MCIDEGGWSAMGRFGRRIIAGRWFMVFSCLLILSVSGGTYIFGLYSEDIKKTLGYDQTTLNLISFFKELGANIGIISGLINEVTPPWVVLLLGAVMNFSGYFFIWLAVTGHISNPQVWWMCLCICVGANSQTFANTGALVTCVKNFPESRGIVIGLLKGYVGLSGAIISQIYHALYGDDGKSLILLIAWLPAVVSGVFLRTVRVMKVNVGQENELKVFYNLLFVSFGLAGVLMAVIIVQNSVTFNRLDYGICVSVIVVFLFSPIILVIREEMMVWKRKKEMLGDPLRLSIARGPGEVGDTRKNDEATTKKPVLWYEDVFRPPERGEDYTILQAVLSVDMLILFAVTITGAGGTLTAIDNLGQIGKSLGYPDKSITTFVSLVSIWGYLGRVASGFASEIFLAKYKFPRPLMLTLVLFLSCSGHLLIAFGVPNSLYAASVLIGLCYGALWPLIFSIISELFGLKHYSTLLNFGGAASPVGAYIFNVRVAGVLYDKVGNKQMEDQGIIRQRGEDLTCTGVECFKLAFLIIAVSSFAGCIVSLILVARTRKFYRSDIYKKFREQAEQVKGHCHGHILFLHGIAQYPCPRVAEEFVGSKRGKPLGCGFNLLGGKRSVGSLRVADSIF
nr:protein NUCLEAR FUSION DEFECTIVE 4-like [Ipomoea batatas]GME11896.1 protein NUCLEAR FUSION DEFECTIVE 4-like [Ipomoea batatas]